jgi:hypothetical protein
MTRFSSVLHSPVGVLATPLSRSIRCNDLIPDYAR